MAATFLRHPLKPRRNPTRWFRPGLLLLALVLLTQVHSPTAFGAPRPASRPPTAWKTLEGCTMVDAAYHDGDSFLVRHGNREYVFRLYHVDTPETDLSYPERIAEQQAAFGGLDREAVIRAGTAASDFTATRLRAGPFRVVTAFERAPGQSATQRYYAIVLIGGHRLGADLVANGLARVHGRSAAWPDAEAGARFRRDLQALAAQARRGQKGAWNPGLRSGTVPAPRIDLNRASIEEIARLPGVGAVLARRIIAARPLRTLADLDAVEGIGPAKLRAMEPLITLPPQTGPTRPTRRKPRLNGDRPRRAG